MERIMWRITGPKGSSFSHDKMISTLQDIVRNHDFERRINDYYIKRDGQEWHIIAFLEKANTDFILYFMDKELVEKKGIKIQNKPKKEQSKAGAIVTPDYSPNEDDDSDFRRYLHDNTLICLDLHRNNLSSSKKITLFARFMIPLSDPLEAKKFLHEHFMENSQHYEKMISKNREDKFWESFSKQYGSKISWNHFYYNLIWGVDLKRRVLEYLHPQLFGRIKAGVDELNDAGVKLDISDEEIKETINQYLR